MKKPALIIFLACFAAGAFASVFDFSGASLPILLADPAAVQKGGISARINGKEAKITRYKSGKKAEKILDYYYNSAHEKNLDITENFYIYCVAEYLLSAGFGKPAYWDYICYEDSPGRESLVIACDLKDGSGVIKARFDKSMNLANFDGFKDGLRHAPGVKLYLSLELLSGKKTINFANFYKTTGLNTQMLKVYYEDVVKKDKWEILSGSGEADRDYYFLQKGSVSRLLGIFQDDEGGEWVAVLG